MIFDRQGLTRILCLAAALSWVSLLLVLAFFATLLLGKKGDDWFGPLIPVAALAFIISAAAVGVLWLWRRCDRCHRRLFSNVPDGIYMAASDQIGLSWVSRLLNASMAPERHFSARKSLNSYRDRAILDYALRGETRCQWCNHEDGAPPDYLVAPGD